MASSSFSNNETINVIDIDALKDSESKITEKNVANPSIAEKEVSVDSSDSQNEEEKEGSDEIMTPPSDTLETEKNEEVEVVDSSTASSGSSNKPHSRKRAPTRTKVLLKRPASHQRTPTISGSKTVIAEVDSSVPHPPKRRKTRKPLVALFSEKDFPLKK